MWRGQGRTGPQLAEEAVAFLIGSQRVLDGVLRLPGTSGGVDEQGEKDRGDSGGELDQVAGGGFLAGRGGGRFPAVEQADGRGEERRECLAARQRRVDQGP